MTQVHGDNSFNSLVEPGADVSARGVIPRFHLHPVMNEAKSAEEGRPIYDEVEYVEILVPGDKDNIVNRPVNELDRRRFAQGYAFWKQHGQQALTGTPLAAWPSISRAQVEELAYFKVSTVEQLAEMQDTHAQKFAGINALRTRARDFLSAAAGAAPATHLRSELDKRDNDIASLKQMLKEQAEQLAELKKLTKR